MSPTEVLDNIIEEKQKAEALKEATEQFLINKDEEETKLTLSFAKALLAIDIEIKDLKEDQKAIKQEAKDEGVSVQKVTKALNLLKQEAKATPGDLAELEEIELALASDVDIKTQISELVKK